MSVIKLDDLRPHITMFRLDGKVDVFPVALIEDLISGKTKNTDVDNWEPMMQTILCEWLSYIKDEHLW